MVCEGALFMAKVNKNQKVLVSTSLRDSGIDLSLLLLNLGLTYEERLRRHDEALRLAEDLREAGKRLRNAKPR